MAGGVGRWRPGSRWPLLLLLAGGVALLLGLWDRASQPSGPLQPARGGRYVEVVVGKPDRVNPLYANFNDADRSLAALVFSGLTRLDENGRLLPDLAESWEVSGDGRTYVFHLRPGALWHDGEPFTADDVVFTWRAIQDPQFLGDPVLAQLWHDVIVARVDSHTVVAQLSQPFAPFLTYASTGILPRHLLPNLDARALAESPFNRDPVGTGPFRLRELSDQRAVLVANPSYHFGQPYLEEIEMNFFPDELSARAALQQGKAQGLLLGPLSSPPDATGQTTERIIPNSLPSTLYTLVYLNLESPLFADRKVRRALLQGLDRDRIIAEVVPGQALKADTPIPPGTWAYVDAQGAGYNPAQARALLESAGWRLNGQGVREKDGRELRFTLVTNDQPGRAVLARAIADQWRQLGVVAEVSVVNLTALVREMLLPRRYEAALFGWEVGPDPDPYPAWHSSQRGDQGRNLAQFADPVVDDVLGRARQVSDMEARRRLYQEFQRLFVADVPGVPLFYSVYTYLLDERVKGFKPGALFDVGSRFASVHLWYMKTRRTFASEG